ncbi:hypothetical protein SAMN04488063_1531 [Halopelagius inordinatus]|uniref:Uncharacterized protein n=1 Tax=Halopelagius inordinatus TaxID=553467 RepID=A0A1I2PHS9_9EURY|nr:hypothetical protein [Halopelagius inordinatus]SFG13557.1 hypothetical protein SAMN04488063_1531 [Halopelagius inordinatus]
MRPRDAVRTAARYHLRAFVPTAAGVGLVGIGLWYGLPSGDGTPLSPTALAGSERAVPALALVGVGLFVVAFGRTVARATTAADLVAAEVESARDEGIDPDDLRETVSLAVQHSVADTMDVASDQIESNVQAAVENALDDGDDESDDATRRVVDPTGEREVRDISVEDVDGRPAAGRRAHSDGDSPDDASREDALATPGEATPSDGEDDENPLAEASRRASERMESLLADDESEFPAETPKTESDGAEILTDDAESTLPDGTAADDAEILGGDRRDGEETAADDGDDESDAEMVFGTDLKDAE